jgi:hypothetical protein
MRQPIGSVLHGALDYLTGTSLIAASRLPTLNGSFAGRALLAAGANHLLYSSVTDYELGIVRKLPYKAHLAVDAVGALGLVAAGATRLDPLDRYVPIGVGLYELGAVLMSDPRSAVHVPERHAVTVNRPEAEVRSFLDAPANHERFAPDGEWTGRYELRTAPGGRGTEIHAHTPPANLRRAKQLLEAGELASAQGPSGRRGALSALLPTLDTGKDAR